MTDLGTLGGNFSQGRSINLSAEVVGSADTSTVPPPSWYGTDRRAAITPARRPIQTMLNG